MQTNTWAAAKITFRKMLNSTCFIIRVRPIKPIDNLVCGETINVGFDGPAVGARFAPFTVFCVHGDGSFSLLIRVRTAGGIAERLSIQTESFGIVWVSGTFPTVTMPFVPVGDPVLAIVAGSGISALGGLSGKNMLSTCDVFYVGRRDDCRTVPGGALEYLLEKGQGLEPRTVSIWDTTTQGRPLSDDLEQLFAEKARYSAVLICGPMDFCVRARQACLNAGMESERVATEYFGEKPRPHGGVTSKKGPRDGYSEKIVVVDLFGKTHAVKWGKDDSLLSALLNAGLEAPYSCRAGVCSTCQCRVLLGEVETGVDLGLSDEEKAEGLSLACQLRPLSDAIAVRFVNATSGG